MPGAPGHPVAIIFDLDTAVIDRRRAWAYAIEEAILTVSGTRVSAAPLADEYQQRPWAHALSVLVTDRALRDRCTDYCDQYFRRSALKRLLVFDGIGMALDRLRGERIEMGGISRESHNDAMRQIESTGIDRFLSVLSPTRPGDEWKPAERLAECAGYLGRAPAETWFVTADDTSARGVRTGETTLALAGWAIPGAPADWLTHPSQLAERALAAAQA